MTFEAERRGAARVSWRREWNSAGESCSADMFWFVESLPLPVERNPSPAGNSATCAVAGL